MLAALLISFREFLEAFLIAGVFLGLSKQLNLKKEFEIMLAVGLGVVLSLTLATGTYLLGDSARAILSESRAELLGAYLMIFSGVFIAYVVSSLHSAMKKANRSAVDLAGDVLRATGFDITFFFVIIFIILREGFEIALFTASVSLFSEFAANFTGLLLGFGAASVIGVVIYFAYTKLPIKKIFTATEYAIVGIGAVMTASGIMKLGEYQFGFHMSELLPVSLPFFENPVSAVPVFLAVAYIIAVYLLFIRKRMPVVQSAGS